MVNYVVRTDAPANVQSNLFFRPGSTRDGNPPSLTTFSNPNNGNFVSLEGTGFAYDGDTNVATAGTVTAITLYAPDFTAQWAAFSNLSVSLVDLMNVWIGPTPGDVFAFLLAGNDVVQGEAQNDRLEGNDGNDTIIGGAGNDTILGGAGNDVIEPGSGQDNVNGGTGYDQLRYDTEAQAGATKGVTVNNLAVTDSFGTVDSVQGIESVITTAFADIVSGFQAALPLNTVYEYRLLEGDDSINVSNIDSYVEPGAGNDSVLGPESEQSNRGLGIGVWDVLALGGDRHLCHQSAL